MEAVMRMSAVKRWHMIDTTKTQTVAEHTANVSLLGYLIAVTSPDAFFSPPALAIAGLIHDLDECWTGDVPTQIKASLGKSSFEALAKKVMPDALRHNPLPRTALLLKVCDLADGIRFVRLNGIDATSLHARIGLENQLAAKFEQALTEWPTVVVDHVVQNILLYAYEDSHQTRNYVAPVGVPSNVRALADDVARKSRYGAGDPRP